MYLSLDDLDLRFHFCRVCFICEMSTVGGCLVYKAGTKAKNEIHLGGSLGWPLGYGDDGSSSSSLLYID